MKGDTRQNSKTYFRSIDYIFLYILFGLILYGLWILFSASSILAYHKYGNMFYFSNKQVFWHLIGLVIMIIVLKIPIDILKKYSVIIIYVSILFLGLVFLPGIGRSVSATSTSFDFKRWIQIGPFSLQPSEFVKISFVLYLAYYLEQFQNFQWSQIGKLFPLGIILLILLLQPQYGTMLLLILTVAVLLLIAGFPLIRLLIMGFSIVPFILFLTIFQPYRFERIQVWLDPYAYRFSKGYQLVMSFRAFQEGGFWGTDISKGIAHRYLVYGHTDFIFALLGESLGIIGVFLLLILYFLLFFRAYILLKRIQEPFLFLFASGIMSLFMIQVLINICVTTGLIPTTGIGLPMVSYGGSSLISYYIMMGLFLNSTRNKNEYNQSKI